MSKFSALELEVDRPSRMPVLHPVTRQPLKAGDEPAYIELHSADSAIARRHQKAVQKRRLDMRGRAKLTPDEIESEAVELLAALTTGWALAALDGSALDVPFSQENARELYSNPAVAWIREQVDEFAADRGNFSKPSSPR